MAIKNNKQAITHYLSSHLFRWLLLVGLGFSAGAVHAETMAWAVPAGLYDTSTPGVTSNVQERFCVRNFSSNPNINAAQWQTVFNTWLTDPKGWGLIGPTKVSFVSSCTNAKIYIDFHDVTDPAFATTCSGGACAGYEYPASGTQVIDGITLSKVKGIRIGAEYWSCSNPNYGCWDTDASRRGVLLHEMGHLMGLGHDGPAMGVTGDGGIYDGVNGTNPSPGEIVQARAHLEGKPSPALAECVGFPDKNHVSVSWFDTANDETKNAVSIWSLSSNTWKVRYSMQKGAASQVGSRVEFLSPITTVLGTSWLAGLGVEGGPRNIPNYDVPFTDMFTPSKTVPNKPCTLQVISTPGGNISYSWKDGSFNENYFLVSYSQHGPGGDNGVLGPWQDRGMCGGVNNEGCADSAAWTNLFKTGDHICVKVAAVNAYGKSADSNIACTYVQ